MLDMIELYGNPNNIASFWSELPINHSNHERVNHAIRLGMTLKPTLSDLPPCASILRAIQADERYQIGRWLSGGSPQIIDCGFKSANGEFAIMLTEKEMCIFLLPPPEEDYENAMLALVAEYVEIDDHTYRNMPLYW